MTKRSPVAVVLLSFLTFTVYAYYWLYRTTAELRDEAGVEDLSPALDVILTLATFGVWGIWAAYRNARIVHDELQLRGEEHRDRSLGVALFGALTPLSGWAWLVSMALLQQDLNRLADAEGELAWDTESARARVDIEPEEPSGWAEPPPAASVFRSSAPMPVVF